MIIVAYVFCFYIFIYGVFVAAKLNDIGRLLETLIKIKKKEFGIDKE
jgi:hypothetical protein